MSSEDLGRQISPAGRYREGLRGRGSRRAGTAGTAAQRFYSAGEHERGWLGGLQACGQRAEGRSLCASRAGSPSGGGKPPGIARDCVIVKVRQRGPPNYVAKRCWACRGALCAHSLRRTVPRQLASSMARPIHICCRRFLAAWLVLLVMTAAGGCSRPSIASGPTARSIFWSGRRRPTWVGPCPASRPISIPAAATSTRPAPTRRRCPSTIRWPTSTCTGSIA